MKIPKELIEQWSNEWTVGSNLTHQEYIAQRAIEWERERLAKLAGEPDAGISRAAGEAVYTQDQLLGAIVRAEDAISTKFLDDYNIIFAERDNCIADLEQQLAKYKEQTNGS